MRAEKARGLVQARAILDPPRMRVNAQGASSRCRPRSSPPKPRPAEPPQKRRAAAVPATATAGSRAAADLCRRSRRDRPRCDPPPRPSPLRHGRYPNPVRCRPALPHQVATDEPRRQETAPVLLQRHHAAAAGRSPRALDLSACPRCGRCSARRSWRAFADRGGRRRRRRLHAGSDACSATSPRRAAATQTIRFVNIRETGGWSSEGARRDAQDRRAAGAGRAARPEPVPRSRYRSEGQLLIVGPVDAALHWAERACRTSCGDGAGDRARGGRRAAGGARVPGLLGRARGRSRAGSGRSTPAGRRPTRSTSTVHPLRRVRPCLPRARDRL